jgi:hypothetical protein
VPIVERLLPRHRDGRRLLRFLTGLALLAVAFAHRADGPVAPTVPLPATSAVVATAVVTTVDVAATAPSPGTTADQAATTVDPPSAGPAAPAVGPPSAGPAAPAVGLASVAVAAAALRAVADQRAHGSRAPPRR